MRLLLLALLYSLCSIFTAQVVYAEFQDPTRPPLQGLENKAEGAPRTLTATFTSSERRLAVIDGMIVKIGDEVAGNRVVAIESNSVQLEGVDGKITLFLVDKLVKQKEY